MLALTTNVSAQKVIQDTLLFPDYSRDLRSMLLYKPKVINIKELEPYKTAIIIVSTFAINEAIVRFDTKRGNFENTTKITSMIYLAGFTSSIVMFHIELRDYKRENIRSQKELYY